MMKVSLMKSIPSAAVLTIALWVPARADVTIKQVADGKGMGMSAKTNTTTYIKGSKMRNDVVMGDKSQTMIFDLDAQKLYMFDSKKKEADVWDMASFGQDMSKNVDMSSLKASVKPNGQTKDIGGQKADGYDMEISMQTAMGGSKDLNMTVTLVGTTWIVKNAPGTADYSRFYKAAAEKGWILSDPRAAKAQPGQAKATAEMYRAMADIGGVPYETNMEIKMGGEGPMAAIMSKMGNFSMSSVVESVDASAIAADLLAPPAGYKLNMKK